MIQVWIPKQRARTTAEGTAVVRAVGTYEQDPKVRCRDEWPVRFLDPQRDSYPASSEVAVKLKEFTERAYPGSYYYYPLARTACIDALLAQQLAEGVRQVVVIGAGYDSCAMRFGGSCDATFIELDLPELQAQKRGVVSRFASARANVRYVAADLASERLFDHLAKILDDHQQTFFICEGLTYYLQQGAVRQLL